MAHHFILLRLNSFDLRIDRDRWWFEHFVSQLRVCLSAEGTKIVSWPWLYPLRGWGSPTLTFTGKLAYIYILFCSLILAYSQISLFQKRRRVALTIVGLPSSKKIKRNNPKNLIVPFIKLKSAKKTRFFQSVQFVYPRQSTY